jgi:outer membrane protein assembly factor BamB
MNRRRLLTGCALLLVAAVGFAAGLYVYDQTRTREVRGSSTDEFRANANPADTRSSEPPRVSRPKRPKPGRKGPLPLLSGAEWWPTYGFDNARSHVSNPFGHRPPFRKEWTFRARHYLEFPPAVAYGRVFIPQQKGRFFAVNADTGRMLWVRHFRRCLASSPVVRDGVVYQAVMHRLPCANTGRSSQRGFVVAMNARNGKTLWRLDTGVTESSPLLHAGRLYFGSWDGNLYAVRARDGRLLWRYRADDELNSAPAYAGGTIFIGSDGGRLHAVDARTGRARWVASAYASFGRREYFYATPTVAYGRVYIGNTDGTMYAFGAGSGRLLWARSVGTYVYTAAAAWKRRIYIGTYDGRIMALDAATGDTWWSGDAPAAVHGAPTVLDGLVYYATCGTCGQKGSRYAKAGPFVTIAHDALTGKRVWSFGDGRYSPIVADGKRVYLVGSTRLYGLVSTRRVRSTAASRNATTTPQSGHTR